MRKGVSFLFFFSAACQIVGATTASIGVDASAPNDTVLRVRYSGNSPSGSAPALVVEGKKKGAYFKAEASGGGTYAVTAVVDGMSIPDLGSGTVALVAAGQNLGLVSLGDEGMRVHGTHRGVSVDASDEDGVGIYAYAWGDYGLAGFFNGDVLITGDCDGCTVSDARFKKNIQQVSGGLDKVMQLKPKVYEMRVNEFRSSINLGGTGKKYGLLAQDMENVVPEVVHDMKVPAHLSVLDRAKDVKKPPVEFKAVNYKALIPILIAAMQEQQAQMEALKREVEQLRSR